VHVLSLLLFLALPVAAAFFAWQGMKLLRGKPALLNRRLKNRSPEQVARVRRAFGRLSLVTSVALFGLTAGTLALRWPFDIWRNLATMIFLGAILWAWFLQRRFGLNDA
jgi:hypothetical protein